MARLDTANSDPTSVRLPAPWRVLAVAAGFVLTTVLLFIGWDGDDFYFLAWVRRVPLGVLAAEVWPPNNLTFRFLLFAPMWAASWLSAEPVWAMRLVGALTLPLSGLLMYAVTKQLVGDAVTALIVVGIALLGADFPWMWTYTSTHWVAVYFLVLWLWLRWWKEPTVLRLGLVVLGHAVALLHYEFLLPLTPIGFVLVVLIEGTGSLERLNRRRLLGAAIAAVPLLVYLIFRFGLTSVTHYYANVSLSDDTVRESWLSFPVAYGKKIADEVFTTGSGGIAGGIGMTIFVLIVGIVMAMLYQQRRAHDRLVRAAAGAAMFCAVVAPFVGIDRHVWSLFPTWALLVCVLQLQPVATVWRTRSLLIVLFVLCIPMWGRLATFLERGRQQRDFAAALQQTVAAENGPVRFWVREGPGPVDGWPLMTSMPTFAHAWLPWNVAEHSAVYAFPREGETPLASSFWETRRPPKPSAPATERVLHWTGTHLALEPAPFASPVAAPVVWNNASTPRLDAWNALGRSDSLTTEDAVVWSIPGGSHLILSPPLGERAGRYRACRLFARLAIPGQTSALLRVQGYRTEEASDLATPAAAVNVPLLNDGQWRYYWLPLDYDPRFATAGAMDRIGLSLADPTITGATIAVAEIAFLP